MLEIHSVKNLHVWSVNHQVATFDDLELSLSHSADVEASNRINILLQELSWWDMNNAKPIDLTGPRYKEFFVLEAQLNLLKGPD